MATTAADLVTSRRSNGRSDGSKWIVCDALPRRWLGRDCAVDFNRANLFGPLLSHTRWISSAHRKGMVGIWPSFFAPKSPQLQFPGLWV